MNPACILFLALLVAVPARAAAPSDAAPSDSAAVAATVARFHEALAAGDSTTVAELLAPDVQIIEGGGIETRHEYLAHHFHGDVAFLKALTREPGTAHLAVAGDAAWVASTSRLHGAYRDRDIDLNSAELMVLRRTDAGWRITAVHWSSGRR